MTVEELLEHFQWYPAEIVCAEFDIEHDEPTQEKFTLGEDPEKDKTIIRDFLNKYENRKVVWWDYIPPDNILSIELNKGE